MEERAGGEAGLSRMSLSTGSGRQPERTASEGLAAAVPLLDIKTCASASHPQGLLQRTHRYFDAVDGVSFKIDAGATLALVGESGCGKTTIGKAIVQLLRRLAVIEGRAVFEGHDLIRLDGDALVDARRSIQIIFQDPFASLNPRRSPTYSKKAVALPELDAIARRERVAAIVERSAAARRARSPREFSGGQRQHVAMPGARGAAKLIVRRADVALDVSVQAQILNLLEELQRTLGVSYLFIAQHRRRRIPGRRRSRDARAAWSKWVPQQTCRVAQPRVRTAGGAAPRCRELNADTSIGPVGLSRWRRQERSRCGSNGAPLGGTEAKVERSRGCCSTDTPAAPRSGLS
jgi:ABC-type dipeptide/oligopeptide/nickel transport system ATPase subunit